MLEAVQLIEGQEYRYDFDIPDATHIDTDRPELFLPDDATGRSGRLRTGLRTGLLPVTLTTDGRDIGTFQLEVRSSKLEYLSQYRWMLRDITHVVSEAIMERFGPTEHTFGVDGVRDARTVYQRFVFLKSLLDDDAFTAALRRVIAHPYVEWTPKTEHRPVSRGVKASSRLARELTRPGPKYPASSQEWAPLPAGLHVPYTVSADYTVETADNIPNRFTKFALTRWRDAAADMLTALRAEPDTTPVRRGIAEVQHVLAYLENVLASPFFTDVSMLRQAPMNNPVLLRRDGYRDIYRAFLQYDLAAQLTWEGGDDIFGAGNRNVATLYEFWTFCQLATILSDVCGTPLDLADVVEVTDTAMHLRMQRGHAVVLHADLVRAGRAMHVELWFNRTFPGTHSTDGSWSRTMRPDCSVRITLSDSFESDPLGYTDDLWIHFDAKYRIETLDEVFTTDADRPDGVSTGPARTATRDDLLKMHAYRDAIRHSAGAYVLYPGDDDTHYQEFTELLPGLGAFGLTPSEDGTGIGAPRLRTFFNGVLDHVASRVTRHERSRYWNAEINAGTLPPRRTKDAHAPFSRPPADTLVLLGFAKSTAHRAWIERERLYNLRADARRGAIGLDARELTASLLLLYGPLDDALTLYEIHGQPRVLNRANMNAFSYPDPGGEQYLCLPLRPLPPDAIHALRTDRVMRLLHERKDLGTPWGAPFCLTWWELLTHASA